VCEGLGDLKGKRKKEDYTSSSLGLHPRDRNKIQFQIKLSMKKHILFLGFY
jgi:hypothetical protein